MDPFLNSYFLRLSQLKLKINNYYISKSCSRIKTHFKITKGTLILNPRIDHDNVMKTVEDYFHFTRHLLIL